MYSQVLITSAVPYIASIADNINVPSIGSKMRYENNWCEVLNKWEINDFKAVLLDCETKSFGSEAFVNQNIIKNFEEDQIVFTTNWGKDRINQRELPLDQVNINDQKSCGAGVDIYVLDTGVDIHHHEFEGRAKWGANFIDCDDNDVAGIAASKHYGIANKANIIAVKVLGNTGEGTWSSVLDGIEYTVSEVRKTKRPSVVNLSLGARNVSQIISDAIKIGAQTDLLQFVCAAGNSADNACNYSPAGAPDCLAVGATDVNDEFAWYSNGGVCVELNAFGSDILSTIPGNRLITSTGTSMAAPQVSGAFARLLAVDPSASRAKAKLLEIASEGLISNLFNLTVNRLLYLEE
jgi:subtilisin family serine protease